MKKTPVSQAEGRPPHGQFNRMPEAPDYENLPELDGQDRRPMTAPVKRLPRDMLEVLSREKADSESVPTALEDKLMNTPYQQLQTDDPLPTLTAPTPPAPYVKSFAIEQTRGPQLHNKVAAASLQLSQTSGKVVEPSPQQADEVTAAPVIEPEAATEAPDMAVAPPPQATVKDKDGVVKPLISVPKTLLFVTMRVPGWSPVQMSLDSRYTSRTVKMIMENRYNVRGMKLFFMGREIKNETSLEEAEVKYNSDVHVVPHCTLDPTPTLKSSSIPKPVRLPPPRPKDPCKKNGGNATGCPVVVSLHPDIALPNPNTKCIGAGDCEKTKPMIPMPSPKAMPKMSYLFADSSNY